MSAKSNRSQGEELWKSRIEKVNGELFALTYGSLVVQLIHDYADLDQVNKQLEKMGYHIGIRIIEDFLARTAFDHRCTDLKETADVITKLGFKMFLGITPTVTQWSPDGNAFSLILDENPLTMFVELPDSVRDGLWYSNLYCGVLRGALEMVQLSVETSFVSCVLRGDDRTEIRVKLLRILEEEVLVEDD